MVLLSLSKPTPEVADATIRDGQARGFCYPHAGASKDFPPLPSVAANHGYKIDHNRIKVGNGQAAYDRAKRVLNKWGHFQLGWAEVDPSTPVKEGAGVCVKSKVAFLWTRHPLQVVYVSERPRGQRAPMGEHPPVPGGASAKARYTFAHGCLHGHMLAGEERFTVDWCEDDSVWYDVAAFSKPAGPLSTLTYPLVRLFQRQFALGSVKAMQAAMAAEP